MNLRQELQAEYARYRTRRWFFKDCGVGLASIAAADLMSRTAGAAPAPTNPLAIKKPHYTGKAKRVIYLFMGGAPSHLELFDNKPELSKWDGKLPPPDLLKGYRAAFINPNSKLLGPKFKFARHGQSGAELSELLPHLSGIADDLTIVRSMKTDAFNHAPGQILMSTGSQIFGRPSFGAWTLYGLGTENQDLPGYVVMQSGQKGPSGGMSNFGCGFLPTVYQGVPFRSSGEPVLYLSNPEGVSDATQRDTLDVLKQLNEERLGVVGDPEIASRINSFELAYRMQQTAPELMDISQEPKHILDMYGAKPGEASFANNCLLARRLIESGVRFVQLFHEAWDHHGGLVNGLKQQCGLTDKPCAALVRDLKQRGLLEDTLVIWGGEFGRTPMVQGGSDGRDHHPNCFSMWFAGGGMKPGITLGQSDEFGFNVTEDPVHVHDLHATLLHLLGFEHTKLNQRFQGLDMRLTGVAGELVPKILA
ncbi:DUF1501 domain-containing protein [Prosthecobacter vanneervenii]|uniref:Sulfatase n=1 Tax=Prosthecobacter vanneervenii TaxID=48466 RepID=A0A7W7YFL0_9BACT|nr:DUF1501 domain-containing protein [Prosthecobacter vanneervenii]MBB5034980.1 hypothetical protein [Prosthecobacter vanneervenii]